ncbi:MAG TPA: ornithine carbamoyltransferase, partial [Methanocorpusculum sp.]|nr:ornithine carbamoyltransferase [Methanocorpusculum sp.]
SMGEEAIREMKLKDFKGFCLEMPLLKRAAPDAIVLHCLPAHRGEEISNDVIESMQSKVWDQAENRLHVQKAVLVQLIGRN